MSRQMLVVAVLFGTLVCAGLGWARPPLNVSVTLVGPDEGFADQGLECTATGGFDLDGPTQTEVTNGEATVEEEYAWSYAPASCDTAPATGPAETFRFALEDSPGEYTITVTYTVTVRYKDGTSDQDFAVDDILVKIKTVEIEIEVADEHICVGGKPAAPYQTTVTVTVKDAQGDGVQGKQVQFTATHEHVNIAPTFQPSNPTTDYQGIATAVLTSGDGAVAGQVQATCEGSVAETSIYFDRPTVTWSIVDPDTGEPNEYLLADGESQCRVIVRLSYEGTGLEGHGLAWFFKFWRGDQNHLTDDPAYLGTEQAPFGSIAPTSTSTDDQGYSNSIYTIGTIGGWINFRVRMLDLYGEPQQ